MRELVGLALFWLGAVYLALAHPWLPGWAWGILLAVLLFAIERRRPVPGLRESGVLLFGWGLGAALADATGLFSLKLVGVGSALWALGRGGERGLEALGAALTVAGGLVGLFEVGAAPWVAVVLVAVGVALWLRGEGPREPEAEERYRRLVAWRIAEARQRGIRVDEVLPDELLPRLVRARSRREVEEVLGSEYADRAEAIVALLFAGSQTA